MNKLIKITAFLFSCLLTINAKGMMDTTLIDKLNNNETVTKQDVTSFPFLNSTESNNFDIYFIAATIFETKKNKKNNNNIILPILPKLPTTPTTFKNVKGDVFFEAYKIPNGFICILQKNLLEISTKRPTIVILTPDICNTKDTFKYFKLDAAFFPPKNFIISDICAPEYIEERIIKIYNAVQKENERVAAITAEKKTEEPISVEPAIEPVVEPVTTEETTIAPIIPSEEQKQEQATLIQKYSPILTQADTLGSVSRHDKDEAAALIEKIKNGPVDPEDTKKAEELFLKLETKIKEVKKEKEEQEALKKAAEKTLLEAGVIAAQEKAATELVAKKEEEKAEADEKQRIEEENRAKVEMATRTEEETKKLKAEKEKTEREAREKADKEARERAEKEAKELAEKERIEREAKEQAEREAKEQAEKPKIETEEEKAAKALAQTNFETVLNSIDTNWNVLAPNKEWQDKIANAANTLILLDNTPQRRNDTFKIISDKINLEASKPELNRYNKNAVQKANSAAKNYIFTTIYANTVNEFAAFNTYVQTIANSEKDAKNTDEATAPNTIRWIYKGDGYYLRSSTFQTLADAATQLIVKDEVPVAALESMMTINLRKHSYLRLESADGTNLIDTIKSLVEEQLAQAKQNTKTEREGTLTKEEKEALDKAKAQREAKEKAAADKIAPQIEAAQKKFNTILEQVNEGWNLMPSPAWQTNISNAAIELIQLKNNTPEIRNATLNTIDKAIDAYEQSLWSRTSSDIKNFAKNNIFKLVCKGTLNTLLFANFVAYFDTVTKSALKPENTIALPGINWIYNKTNNCYYLHPTTLQEIAQQVAQLIVQDKLPLDAIERLMDTDLREAKRGNDLRLETEKGLTLSTQIATDEKKETVKQEELEITKAVIKEQQQEKIEANEIEAAKNMAKLPKEEQEALEAKEVAQEKAAEQADKEAQAKAAQEKVENEKAKTAARKTFEALLSKEAIKGQWELAPSRKWQNDISNAAIALIKLENTPTRREGIVVEINKAINNYTNKLSGFTGQYNTQQINVAKSHIAQKIYNGTIPSFDLFARYFKAVAASPVEPTNTENVAGNNPAIYWIFNTEKGEYVLRSETLDNIAHDAATLIEQEMIPQRFIVSMMDKSLVAARKGKFPQFANAKDLGITGKIDNYKLAISAQIPKEQLVNKIEADLNVLVKEKAPEIQVLPETGKTGTVPTEVAKTGTTETNKIETEKVKTEAKAQETFESLLSPKIINNDEWNVTKAPSINWQNDIVEATTKLIQSLGKDNKPEKRREIFNAINKAINDVSNTKLWNYDNKAINIAKNNIFTRICAETVSAVNAFSQALTNIVNNYREHKASPTNAADWIYKQQFIQTHNTKGELISHDRSYYYLKQAPFDKLYAQAKVLIDNELIPVDALERMMNVKLQEASGKENYLRLQSSEDGTDLITQLKDYEKDKLAKEEEAKAAEQAAKEKKDAEEKEAAARKAKEDAEKEAKRKAEKRTPAVITIEEDDEEPTDFIKRKITKYKPAYEPKETEYEPATDYEPEINYVPYEPEKISTKQPRAVTKRTGRQSNTNRNRRTQAAAQKKRQPSRNRRKPSATQRNNTRSQRTGTPSQRRAAARRARQAKANASTARE